MTKDEALKLALEALEEAADAIDSWGSYASGYFQVKHDLENDISKAKSAITAIKEALAQPEQLFKENERLHVENRRLIERIETIGVPVGVGGFVTTTTQPEQEPVAWIDFQKEAQQIVESKVLWKRFIDGTPLANDIACWMADFAQYHTTPPQRKPLTENEIKHLWYEACQTNLELTSQLIVHLARNIEAAHGIKENT